MDDCGYFLTAVSLRSQFQAVNPFRRHTLCAVLCLLERKTQVKGVQRILLYIVNWIFQRIERLFLSAQSGGPDQFITNRVPDQAVGICRKAAPFI